MDFISCYESKPIILMEGAIGERLKREFNMQGSDLVALADIIYRPGGKIALYKLWNQYINVAKLYSLPFIATTPTRRANMERIHKAGYDESIIKDNVTALRELQIKTDIEMYIGGLMGCKGDAYKATEVLNIDKAKKFHTWAAEMFTREKVDFLYAGIMPVLSEAIGIAMAMEETNLPYIISFMLRDNGRLIDGTTIHDAILNIDNSVKIKPICYMANCIHPSILYKALSWDFNKTSLVRQRFRGIQANTSALPPEILDNSNKLRFSNCVELGKEVYKLTEIMDLKIIGGCCGTDDTHIDEIARIFTS